VTKNFSQQIVHHIAQLANIPVSSDEETKLATQFEETIEVVAHLSELDTTNVEPTSQVTGLENVWREDIVDAKRMFTQDQALANAQKKDNGYFVVSQIIAHAQ
jgi:aspartyl-tRNA(Asn)/glutamyl-tRNA(Gln) amidotransferase subunit C